MNFDIWHGAALEALGGEPEAQRILAVLWDHPEIKQQRAQHGKGFTYLYHDDHFADPRSAYIAAMTDLARKLRSAVHGVMP